MSDIREALAQIESALADMLDTHANLREKYVRNPDDFHSLRGSDRDIACEVQGIRQAASLLREHRDETSGMGVPSYLEDEWTEKERATSELLDSFLVVPRSDIQGTEYGWRKYPNDPDIPILACETADRAKRLAAKDGGDVWQRPALRWSPAEEVPDAP